MSADLKRRLAASVIRSHPDQAARLLERADPSSSAAILSQSPPEDAQRVLEVMLPDFSGRVLTQMPADQARELLLTMPASGAAAFLRRVPSDRAQALLGALPGEVERRVRNLLKQREGTAGALADPDAFVLPEGLTAGEALSRWRSQLVGAMHELPVVDAEFRLVGMLALRALTSARKQQTMAAIMQRNFPSIRARAPLRSVASDDGWRTHSSLPVVDSAGGLVGMLRQETVRATETKLRHEGEAGQTSTSEALGDLFGTAASGLVEAVFHAWSIDDSRKR